MPIAPVKDSHITVQGVRLELNVRGQGTPLLFLHPDIGLEPSLPFLDRLAETHQVFAPSHPGFGRSELPRSMSNVDDLSYFYLDLIKALDLRDVCLMGAGFGGWIAAEIAVKTTQRISKLVLVDSVGIKISARDSRDIADVFTLKADELLARRYHDRQFGEVDPKSLSEEAATIMFRNRESLALFAWSPYMHNPKLAGRLHRIDVPTLVLWGESDGIVSPDYGRAYGGLIDGAQFAEIEKAGHYPQIEQPDVFAQHVARFAASTTSSRH